MEQPDKNNPTPQPIPEGAFESCYLEIGSIKINLYSFKYDVAQLSNLALQMKEALMKDNNKKKDVNYT